MSTNAGDPYKILEEQLAGAVRARRVRRWSPRRWPRGVVPAIAVAAVLGTGAATAAVVLRPDDQPANEVKQALFAGEQAADGAAVCRRVRAAQPRLVDDPVPPGLLAQLGVLRRPATAADRLPPGQVRFGAADVLRRSIRVARASDGWSYRFYLSRGVLAPLSGPADPVACARVRRDAAIAAAERFDPGVRTEVARRVNAEVGSLEDQAAGQTLSFTLMEQRPDGRGTGGGGGFIKGDRIPAAGGIGHFRRGNHRYVALSGLVPDGVARVRVLDGSGSPRERPRTIEVRDNVFHALLPRRFGPRLTVEWRSPSGRVLRRTHPRY
ncbi:MAG TPA: hypothetical protein VNT55_01285 [Baekduia sp.]|nr:hypothetical protein [Baekduia sp.]